MPQFRARRARRNSRAHERQFPGHGLQPVPECEVGYTETAKLRDMLDQEIRTHGKNIVDVRVLGDETEIDVFGSIKLAVSDAGRDVVSMGGLLRAEFEMHFTNCGHTCWLRKSGERTAVHQDDFDSEAPLCGLRLEVLLPPGCADRESAISNEKLLRSAVLEEFEEGMVVEIAGLLRDTTLNGLEGLLFRKGAKHMLIGRRLCHEIVAGSMFVLKVSK